MFGFLESRKNEFFQENTHLDPNTQTQTQTYTQSPTVGFDL